MQKYQNGRGKGDGSASCSSSPGSSPLSSSTSSPMSSPQDSPTHSSKEPPTENASSNCTLFEYKSSTLPAKLDLKNIDWDELDDLLQVIIVISPSFRFFEFLLSTQDLFSLFLALFLAVLLHECPFVILSSIPTIVYVCMFGVKLKCFAIFYCFGVCA